MRAGDLKLVRIELGQTGNRTRVLDAETGQPIPGVRRLRLTTGVGEPTIARLEVIGVDGEFTTYAALEAARSLVPILLFASCILGLFLGIAIVMVIK